MSLEGFKPIEYERLGGLMTFVKQEDVPQGFSPDCQNVRYRPSSVETRPGLTPRFTKGGVTFTGLSQFISNQFVKTLLTLDSNGDLDKESGASLVSVQDKVATVGAMMRSQPLFDNIFFSFFGGERAVPYGPIRLFDGTNLDPVAPEGPGAAPTAADSGTGVIEAGVHKGKVLFEFRSGALSESGPEFEWTAAGLKKATISTIPTGPGYVVARHLIFTASGGEDFFSLGNTFRIDDNTSTSVEVDFNDTEIQQGVVFNKYERNHRLSDQSGIGVYGSRLTTWGGLNIIRTIRNLGFDGGFLAAGEPLGWVQGGGFAGGAKESADAYHGEAWKITGDGATATRGQITQAEAATALRQNTAYTVSVRVKKTAGLAAGRLNIDVFGTSPSVDSTGLQLLHSAVTEDWVEYEAELTPAIADIPTDLVLRVFADQTPTNAQSFIVDRIQIYPTNKKYDASVVRVSDNFDIRFDGINGFITISKDDGERVMHCIELRGYYYIYKERGVYVTEDDGSNPPSLWPVRRLDKEVGAGGPNAVGEGQAFHVIASRNGPYLNRGGVPMWLGKEIIDTWQRINWNAAQNVHALVDSERSIVRYHLPLDGSTTISHTLTLDYIEGWGSGDDPGGRKWSLDVYPDPIRASILFEKSDNTKGIYYATDKIQEETDDTDDDAVAIDSFYETAFGKAGNRGQDLFGGVVMNISGSGQLETRVRGLDNNPDVRLKNLGLNSSPGKEYEVYANVEAEKARVRIRTSAIGARFSCKRIALYGQPWADTRPI